MYQLSQTFYDNQRDIRTLDYDPKRKILITGDLKHYMNIYKQTQDNNKKYFHINKIDIFQKQVNCLKINKYMSIKNNKEQQQNSNSHNHGNYIYALAGIRDGKIFAFDKQFNPIHIFQYNSAISSIDFINHDYFVTGSWDGKANIWSIKQNKIIKSYQNHKYAVSVFYNPLTDQIISGSQDKSLVRWDWKTGNVIKRKQNAHNDIIRQICPVDEVGFVTCSNDQTVKLWTSQLDQLSSLSGHSAFIFSVKSKGLGFYVSGGQDRCIKVWKDQQCQQTIQIPASVWSIVIDQNNDIIAGCSDGTVRTFTTDSNRKADKQTLDKFNAQAMQSISKKSGMSAQQIQKLPTISSMIVTQGKKNGQIRVFRNGNIPEAFMWQNGKWDKIGQVITQGAATSSANSSISQPKYYPGDKYFEAGQYDHIFDVQDDSGQRKLIPFNDGGNPLDAAQRYCARQGMSRGYTQQIRKFLMANSSKIPRKVIQQAKKAFSPDLLKVTPQMAIIQFNDVKNPKALFEKIKQFNQKVQHHSQLNEKQLGYVQRITLLLQNSSNYHSWTLDFKQMDAIKKLLTWPKEHKFPVWDTLRAFLKHYQSQTFFNGLDAGADIIGSLAGGLQMDFPQPILALILKTFCNMAIQNTNKVGLLKHGELIFLTITNISKKNFKNKAFLSAMATFFYNFSIISIQKKIDQKQRQSLLKSFSRCLGLRMQIDSQTQDNKNLMLYAAANVLFKHRDIVLSQMGFIRKYLSESQVSIDLKNMLQC